MRSDNTIFRVINLIVVVLFMAIPFPVYAGKATLKLSHQWPQDTDYYVIQTAIRFADEISKRTNGEIKINFHPSQFLVKAREQFKAMR